jgi:mannose-6-phosphate isomerase-like protein (cupin superfamily)
MPIEIVNLARKLASFDEHWSPKIVADVNEAQVKLVKFQGEFVWHRHEREDELFLVLSGRLLIRLRERELWLDPGEFVVIPRGVEHCPVAREEVHVMLVEPKSTLNTGDVQSERTIAAPERI